MTLYQWFIFFLVLQVIHFLGTWKLYQKAGRKSWEAAIPVYNAIILMKIINRPAYWVILLFLPVINLIMFPVVWVETLRSFGKNSTLDTILGVATLGLYIYYINYTQNVTYIQNRSLVSTTKAGDTVSSILFAVVVATIVHTYFIQPFTIPTASLEKTLLVGDFLFVSKYNYGARVPMTPIALPMVHDTIPVAKTKSYLSSPQLPYLRFPGFEKVAKNDIVVFNWPSDTVHYFYEPKGRPGVIKPVDKKSNYVKRCVGTPGDILTIKDGIVFINGKELQLSDRAKPQYTHTVYAAKGVSNELLKATGSTEFTRAYIIKPESQEQINAIAPYATMGSSQNPDGSIKIFTGYKGIPEKVIQKSHIYAQEVYEASAQVNLTLKGAEALRKNPAIDSVVRYIAKIADKSPDDTSIFPHDGKWTIDNFGPITIPQEGKSVTLTKENLPLYQRIIQVYEKNDLKVNGDEIRINGQVANSYTFKQDYFWMMGDNRHRSEDSRYWGFVPDDHIVGKPVFIWLSIDGINDGIKNWSIRWERLFTTVGGEGEPYSYFKFFLIAVAAYFGITFFLNKRKEKQTKNL
jgi:signal peptidase I